MVFFEQSSQLFGSVPFNARKVDCIYQGLDDFSAINIQADGPNVGLNVMF
jgi:hypothetical protein